ncbi:MAG: hypothetical protein E6H02_07975 [Bacillati bacterium ANGP1]|uniref:Uncharacterized protein n=1 Tax=Candidatus Segetimicrobium genomatis TaxID=2569760 RepID=A0A537LRF2_9BACT|nr:MAG: hypothetical protein E6H02_07975 [Terrabacteria group bacterium ANGP1]
MFSETLVTQAVTGAVAFLAAVASIHITDGARRKARRDAALQLLTTRLKLDEFDTPNPETTEPRNVLYIIPGHTEFLEWIVQADLLDPRDDGQLIANIVEHLEWVHTHREYVRMWNLKLFFKPHDERRIDKLALDATQDMHKSGYVLYEMLTKRYHAKPGPVGVLRIGRGE